MFKELDIDNPLLSWEYHNIILGLDFNNTCQPYIANMDEYEIKIACWKPEYIFKNTELYKKMIDLQSKYEYLDICEVDFVRYPKRAWLPWHKDPSAYAIIWPITPTTNVKIEYKTKETYVRKTKPVFLNSEEEHRTHPCDEDIIFFRLGVNKYV